MKLMFNMLYVFLYCSIAFVQQLQDLLVDPVIKFWSSWEFFFFRIR